jgi:hypothetical protein
MDDLNEPVVTYHAAVQHVLAFFTFSHLPERLQDVSRDFHNLAVKTADRAPDNPETTVALRKLLEAKDAAVRACVRDISNK